VIDAVVFPLAAAAAAFAPIVLVLAFSTTTLFGWRPSERLTAKLTQSCVLVGLIASVSVWVGMLATGNRNVTLALGEWVSLHDQVTGSSYHFNLKFVFDRLSIPMLLLTYGLVGTVGAFANRYLHREAGYGRFFSLYALFLLGMVAAIHAGSVETLFLGWELVGLSSALLVAFFHNRRSPVESGQRVWTVYRVSDAALLIAVVALHHADGAGDFSGMTGAGVWPYGESAIAAWPAFWIGLLLLIAAAGKSGLLPFCEWLPRAMEGPTPSSAVFYGALSVHLGAYLLLRVSPLLHQSPALCVLVVALGITTAAYAAVVARVQTDIKTALAFASLSQVGLIVAEIGCGFCYLALVHIVGHASFRTLQLLRAPSILHDHISMEDALGPDSGPAAAWSPPAWLYRFAYARGELDSLLERWFVRPFLAILRRCERVEERIAAWWEPRGAAAQRRDEGASAGRREAV
jgi:NAD(P)H-quinone oxidoreductase subunit 5